MPRSRSASLSAKITDDARLFQSLKTELVRLEYFTKGTVLTRMMKCGKPKCPCASDPTKRHGPYFEWTYKENGKTINVRLTAASAPLFRDASQQYRRLKRILTRLEKLSRQAIVRMAKQATTIG